MSNWPDIENFIPIVLCAGFGTRLRPLTNFIPKVACPVLDKPIAFRNIEMFLNAGFEKVHCNIHYLAQTAQEELTQAAIRYGYDPSRLVFWYEEKILETGGGVFRIFHELATQDKKNLHKDLIVVSGDIIADFPLFEMLEKWKNKSYEDAALMCTTKPLANRKDVTWVSSDFKYILGFGEKVVSTAEKMPRNFSNHQIIGKEIVQLGKLEAKSSVEMFYKNVINMNKKIIHLQYPDENYWFNVGTPEEYFECIHYFSKLEKTGKKQGNILNYAHKIPENLKSSLTHFMKENQKSTFDEKHLDKSVIIAFHEKIDFSMQKQFISLNSLLNIDGEGKGNDFIIAI